MGGMMTSRKTGWRRRAALSLTAGLMTASASLATTARAAPAQATGGYTVNGAAVAPEMGDLMAFYGFAPGAYYVDANGNYGASGEPPAGNLDGGPTRNWGGVEPTGVDGNSYARAYVNGVRGVRVFWVYSPSIFSEAKGGSSGYVHVCPNNIYHRSSEGAISVGGEYNPEFGVNESSAGVAGVSQSSGKWAVESGPNGPTLALYAADGGAQRVPLATMLQGRWKFGQTSYATEVGKASC